MSEANLWNKTPAPERLDIVRAVVEKLATSDTLQDKSSLAGRPMAGSEQWLPAFLKNLNKAGMVVMSGRRPIRYWAAPEHREPLLEMSRSIDALKPYVVGCGIVGYINLGDSVVEESASPVLEEQVETSTLEGSIVPILEYMSERLAAIEKQLAAIAARPPIYRRRVRVEAQMPLNGTEP